MTDPTTDPPWHARPRYNSYRDKVKFLNDGRGASVSNGLVPQFKKLAKDPNGRSKMMDMLVKIS